MRLCRCLLTCSSAARWLPRGEGLGTILAGWIPVEIAGIAVVLTAIIGYFTGRQVPPAPPMTERTKLDYNFIRASIALIKATTREEVMRIAEFVLTTAQGLQRMGHTPPLICSLSIGACLVGPEGDFNDWYASADAALYRAKRDGGNRVEWQDNRPMPA